MAVGFCCLTWGADDVGYTWIQSYLQDRAQFLKLGQQWSSETTLEVGVPQGSVLDRCCSPCTAVQLLTSSRPMASDAINTQMTLSFI